MKKPSLEFIKIASIATNKVQSALVDGDYNIEELVVVAAQTKPRAIPAYASLKCEKNVNIAVSRLFRPIFDADSKAIFPVVTGLGVDVSATAMIENLTKADTALVKVSEGKSGFRAIFDANGKMIPTGEDWTGAKLLFKGEYVKAEDTKLYNFEFTLTTAVPAQ